MAAGEMSPQEFSTFLQNFLHEAVRIAAPGSIVFVFMDWRHMSELLSAATSNHLKLLNLCIWVKPNAGMGSFYRSQHELVFAFRAGSANHRNNVQLGRFGRNRTNVWNYPNGASFGRSGEEGDLTSDHPTVKPVQMVADAILDCSRRGDSVLDPFLGSGTTLMAAERTGRVCHGIELDPLYVDLAIRRWQRHTGQRAILTKSGRCFDDVSTKRRL
jgi:DNA modification methylase